MDLIFEPFPKIARLNRDCVITEKIDGTNAQIYIELGAKGWIFLAGSRNRFLTPEKDNFGFAAWAETHRDELIEGLGEGRHFGEWYGSGIQRGYDLPQGEKRFALFNVGRWFNDQNYVSGVTGKDRPPTCCGVVPVLYSGPFRDERIEDVLRTLRDYGSAVSRGFMRPEGIVVWHSASQTTFKVTLENDEAPKSLTEGRAARILAAVDPRGK